MKRYHLYIITLMAGLLLLNACQDEEMYPKKSDVPEGIPVTAQLSFSLTETQEVHTKADLGKDQENAVKDLYFFVFDYTTKKLEYAHHHTIDPAKQSKVSSGTVTFQTNAVTSGKKNILAIANTETYAEFSSLLSKVNTMDDLAKLYATLKEDSRDVLRMSGNFMMSGYFRANGASDDTEKGYCEIFPASEGQTAPVKLGGTVYLRHLDSKIKFDVNVDDASTKVFIPKSWKVVNVPAKSYVFENPVADVSADKSDYFSTSGQPFEVFSLTPDGTYKGGSFIFYMFENRKKALGEPKGYEDRERQKKDVNGMNGDYLYADPLAGYVVLTGSYYEYDKNHDLKKSADVKYTIHLGYVGNKPSDFNSERNISYTYHVTVKGVDNIELEVETSGTDHFEERQPGAEGQVVKADQNLLFDSHYETDKVVFNIDKIGNLSVLVKTPYDRNGTYEITDYTKADAFEDKLTDFRWVQFAKNQIQGDGRYFSHFVSYTDAYRMNNLVTVKELLQTLRKYTKENGGRAGDGFWDADGNVIYTVFIDEFYYENKPKKLDTDPDVKASWKEFVNWENRQMYILCDTKFSADKQSSLTKSSILIDQRSIKSIYNLDAADLKTAWGIESVSEEKDRVKYSGGQRNETKTNGRYNTYLLWKSYVDIDFRENAWNMFIDFSVNENKEHTAAEYACLLRNRDLDGDGVIDADEVRWYLPATNQYVGLWIGRDALPADVRLFQANVKEVAYSGKYHFVSSNGVRFWSEEGVSTESNNAFEQKYNIRCARNLGGFYKGIPYINDEPEDYVKADLDGDNRTTKVYLDYLNPAALRDTKKSAIIFHSEHSGGELNRPYKAFEVYPNVSDVKIDYANKILQNEKCPAGYRVPNQRELALIAAYSTSSFGHRLGSCTYSELTYKGFIYSLTPNRTPNFLSLDNNNKTTTKARCIKDVD